MTRRNRAGLLIGMTLWVSSGCSTDREDPRFQNPLDPDLGSGLPVPRSVEAAVGDNVVELSWTLPEGETAEEFAVFRRRVDVGNEQEELLERVEVEVYTDTGVRNGRTYDYRVAAGVGGQFGSRSEATQATPGLFTILIAADAEVTRNRSVSVSPNVLGAESIQLSEDSDDFSGPWRPIAGSTNWTLSSGDGIKTVYARFRMQGGSLSLPVFDTIRLDTRAVIDSVAFDGAEVRAPGETIHFRIVAGEVNGTAGITVAGVFNNVALFDDGTGGDAVGNDGTYERDLVVPTSAAAFEEDVRGAFTDEAGNQADPVTAPRQLTALPELDAVELIELRISDPPQAASATLRWTRSLDGSFSAYRIFRSEASPVGATDEQVGSVTSSGTLDFEDRDVVEGTTYYYRVFVEDARGRQTGSNELSALVPNVRPPAPVTIESSLATSADRIALAWSESSANDFSAYRVYRNETGAVTELDVLVADITDVTSTFWDDNGLVENTTYYYRVYTFDQGGLSGRSPEVAVTTVNEPPLPVALLAATDVDASSATLSWTESTVHDFASYRLYRDEIPTVTSGSTLAVELDDRAFTSFRDEELEADTQYYYRVFVVDDGDPEEFAGSNTISVMTTGSIARVSP